MSCVLVLAFLCLQDVASIEVSPPGPIQSAIVRMDNSVVTLMLNTDGPLRFDWRHMIQACTGSACIFYHKHCGSSEGEVTCSYYLMQPGAAIGRSFDITAPNRNLVTHTERSIGILAQTDEPTRVVRLTALNVESDWTLPPLYETAGANAGAIPTDVSAAVAGPR